MGISTVTSEALQLKIRQLLPSQSGFGTDLSASDTIIPVIDLTDSAEGSQVPTQLQEAFFAGQTSVELAGSGTSTLVNTPGFYRIDYQLTVRNAGSSERSAIRINDGAAVTNLVQIFEGFSPSGFALQGLLTVFLSTGDSVELFSDVTASYIHATARQIADTTGTLIQPVGFNPQ